MAAALTATSGCGLLLEDKGPLPPRYSGPPLPADTVVSELTAALKAEGVTLERTPQDLVPIECHERLTGQHESATAGAALESGFARARSDHGWQTVADPAEGLLSLRKGNWTAATTLPGTASAESGTTAVSVVLMCDGGRAKSSSATGSREPAPTSSRAGPDPG